jgi:hypothetical protein
MTQTKVEAPFVANNANFRNLFINGDMNISQRGTSVSGISSGTSFPCCDRWKFQVSSAGTWTVSQSTTVPTGEGFANSFKLDCTTANGSLSGGSYLFLRQEVEGQFLQQLKKGTSSAEKTTLSFWVRSNVTGTYIVEFDDNDNTRNINKAYTIDSANTWEKKSIVFEGDTTGAFGNDANSSARIFWWLSAGTNWTSGTLATSWEATNNTDRAVGQVNLASSTDNEWYITGVQWEVGDQATDFEHLPFDVQLRRCERYCHKWISEGTYDNVGRAISTTGGARPVYYVPTTMRNGPSLSADGNFRCYNATDSTVSVAAGDVTMSRAGPNTQYLNFAASLTAEKNCECGANNDNTAFIIFDSEL